MRHGFFGELAIGFVGVRYERHTPGGQNTYTVYLPPLGHMSRYYLFDVIRDVYSPHVQSTILAHEAADAAHIIPVVIMLVATKAVHVRVKMIM